MPRRRYIALAAIPLVALGGYLVWRAIPRDQAVPVAPGEAVRIFRQRAVEPLTARRGEPAPGVYRYATTGGESVETALGVLGTTHRYRGTSTISVIPTRCGFVERWQVLATRWTEVKRCREPPGYRLVSIDEAHEFFGVRRYVLYRCREPPRPSAARLKPGMEWHGHCVADGSSRDSTVRVLGVEGVRVGGESFAAIHTQSRRRMSGTYSGSGSQEDWRRRSDGLLLRRISRTDGSNGGGVEADYTENYRIELIEPRPAR